MPIAIPRLLSLCLKPAKFFGVFFGGVYIGVELRCKEGVLGYHVLTFTGISMQPTLTPIKPRLLGRHVNRCRIRRGDIVCILVPHPAGNGEMKTAIKRVIGLPGEEVWNDRKEAWEPVPEGHVYVLGDNRKVSRDSRRYGAVPIENIKKKIVLQYRPLKLSLKYKESDDSSIVRQKQ
ncbi:hypothetical protein QR680_014092 [Steinernema hermaphroditum]|uniref:Mitochondrial inner membrane protease subunit 2 n=1 Tax=Steinernema hermaphroditum TaxID=289476 RepID=A0AA39I9R5_9BILA|nr:hypothetical protein QR680_014092 [Steinernema hermaphroditum]